MNWYVVSWRLEWNDEYNTELIFGSEDTIRKDVADLKGAAIKDVVISSIYKYNIAEGSC